MEETTKNDVSSEETLGRRELLKALAATGGAVAATTLLPGKWIKPVIEVGMLPAHAQGSALAISNFNIVGPLMPGNEVGESALVLGVGTNGDNGNEMRINYYEGSFNFSDFLKLVDETTILHADFSIVDAAGMVQPDPTLGQLMANINDPNTVAGLVSFIFGFSFYGPVTEEISSQDTQVEMTISIETNDRRISNTDSDTFIVPNNNDI